MPTVASPLSNEASVQQIDHRPCRFVFTKRAGFVVVLERLALVQPIGSRLCWAAFGRTNQIVRCWKLLLGAILKNAIGDSLLGGFGVPQH